MANLSSLAPVTTAITTLSNLILVSPQKTQGYQPQNPTPLASQSPQQQPPAFLFDYEGDNSIQVKSDITDHYVENNTPIEDNIALKPVTIAVQGFIGELNDVPPKALAAVAIAVDKLTTISAYTPGLSTTALIAYSEAFFLYQTAANAANSAVSAISSLSGAGGESVINGQGISLQANQNRQQTAFQLFYGYWLSRTLFTVQTPWAVFQNMAIESLVPVQDASTRMITEFQITFKMIRYTSTSLAVTSTQGRLGSQSAGITDLGTQTPQAGPTLSTQLNTSFPTKFPSVAS